MVVGVGNDPTRQLLATGYQPIPLSYQASYKIGNTNGARIRTLLLERETIFPVNLWCHLKWSVWLDLNQRP